MNPTRSRNPYHWLFRAAVATAGVGVALGAFGAHGLESVLPQWYPDPAVAANRLEQWQTAVQYQLIHALGAMVMAASASPCESKPRFRQGLALAALLLLIGATIFSGCLYLLVLTGKTWLGAIVPIGGVIQLLGWATATFTGLPVLRSDH